ncbi:MAG TPA: response regulator FixJ [Azospirillaceae bacterium]|nr:response regulator FixJ [Azospirillaceae bacterium]
MLEPTVFVVDDDDALRDSLSLLVETAGYKVETFPAGEPFLDAFDPERPGCLLADVRMPGMSGLDLLRELKRWGATLPVIVITGHGDVAMAVSALKDGALDFIEKPFDASVLMDSIRDALDRQDRDQRSRLEAQEILDRMDTLTPREREVMDLVVAGHSNKVIAGRLDISTRTVEVHRARVMEKMRARNLSELVRMALKVEAREPALA